MPPSPSAPWTATATFQRLAVLFTLLLAATSILQGAHLALSPTRSQDLQWSGERILFDHLDPWAEYLHGDPNHRFLLSQFPNYLPLLYVLITPLGFLSADHAKLAWLGCNLVFALASVLLTARFYGLRGRLTFLLATLFFIATPTRNTLANGQQSLLVLLFWCLAFLAPTLTPGRIMAAGASYFKFNFAPPVVFYLLFRGGLRSLLLSAVPPAIGTAIIWLWLTGGRDLPAVAHLIVEPLQVSQRGYFPSGNNPNLMDVLQTALLAIHLPMHVIDPTILLAALVVCFAVLRRAVRSYPASVGWHLALLGNMSFCLFRHHDYDSVVLLFPFAYALRLRQHRLAQAVLLLIGFDWFFLRLLETVGYFSSTYLFTWTVLMVALYLTYRLRTFEPGTAFDAPGPSSLASEPSKA